MRVLVINEDRALNNHLVHNLQEEDFGLNGVDVVETFEDAAYYLDIRYYELVLVNWKLVKEHNFFNLIEDHLEKMSVIVLSDSLSNEVEDKKTEIRVLREGADDYLRQPLDFNVFKARVVACLRRRGFFNDRKPFVIKGLTIDSELNKIFFKDKNVVLGGKPLEVFRYLAERSGQIISKEQLLYALWVEPEMVTPQVIDVSIHKIRREVDKALDIVTIETVARRGYRFMFTG